MKYIVLITSIIFSAIICVGQDMKTIIKVNIVASESSQKNIYLKDVMVILNDDQSHVGYVDSNGEFEISIPINTKLKVTFTKKGYIPKSILINTDCPEEINQIAFFDLQLILDKYDQKTFSQDFMFPIAKIEYNRSLKKFEINKPFSRKMKSKYNHLIKEI